MGEHIIDGDPPIRVRLRPSRGARRISLRVSSLDGQVTLTFPARVPRREALAFAEERRAWIRDAQPVDRREVGPGVYLPVEGRMLMVTEAPGRRPGIAGEALWVRPGRAGPDARAVLKTLARDRLARAADAHAARLGATIAELAFRDTRSRWGSCSGSGRLMFSWRLAMAPPEVLDYVAAHEVAHLERMDHSPAFWAVVERLCPDWRRHRAWLREHGSALHRYRFEAPAETRP